MANDLLSQLRRRDRFWELVREPLNPPGFAVFGILGLAGFFVGTGMLFLADELEIWEPPLWLFALCYGSMIIGYIGAMVCELRDAPKQEAILDELRGMIKESGGTVPKLPWE